MGEAFDPDQTSKTRQAINYATPIFSFLSLGVAIFKNGVMRFPQMDNPNRRCCTGRSAARPASLAAVGQM
jgi:hypothetical protein